MAGVAGVVEDGGRGRGWWKTAPRERWGDNC